MASESTGDVPFSPEQIQPELSSEVFDSQAFTKIIALAVNFESSWRNPKIPKNPTERTNLAAATLSRIVLNKDLITQSLAYSEYGQQTLDFLNKFYQVDYGVGIDNDVVDSVYNFASQFVADNFSKIAPLRDESETRESRRNLMNLVSKSIEIGDPSQRFKYFMDHLEDVFTGDSLELGDPLIRKIIDVGTDEQKAELWKNLERVYLDPQTQRDAAKLIGFTQSMLFLPEQKDELKENLIYPILEAYGLPVDELKKLWEMAGDTGYDFMLTFRTITEIEAKRPNQGISKTLYDEFGIANFARYSPDMLIAQFDHRDDIEMPFGVLFMAKKDRAGFPVFSSTRDKTHQFTQDLLEKGYLFRAYEVGSKLELGKTLVGIKKKYQKKASFGILSGHGAPDHVSLGEVANVDVSGIDNENPHNQISVGDLSAQTSERWGEIFEPNADIVVVSCLTGQGENSVGEALSTTLAGKRVLAPEELTDYPVITPEVDEEGKIKMSVDYRLGRVKIPSREFIDGKAA